MMQQTSRNKKIKMKMKFILLLVVFIVAEGLLLRLGVWQMHRMAQKETEKSAQMANLEENKKIYTGVFDHSREVVLESQKRRNDYGYRILTPLVTDTQEIIVDRGWIHRQFVDDYLERFQIEGTLAVKGVMRSPPELKQTFFKGPIEGVGAKGVRVLKLLKLDEILPHPTLPRADKYLQATVPTHPDVDAFFVPPKGGAKHKEYMLTWFSLAVILPLLLLGAFVGRRRKR